MNARIFMFVAIGLSAFQTPAAQSYNTCADWMKSRVRFGLANGVYNITNSTNHALEMYCIFDYHNNFAWTLIESGTRSNYQSPLRDYAFFEDFSRNVHSVNKSRFSLYRLSYNWMYHLQSNSQYLYSTCEFNTSFIKDWVLFNVSTFDVLSFNSTDSCVNVISASINGTQCAHTTIDIVQDGVMHAHLSEQADCGCSNLQSGDAHSYDWFGAYFRWDPSFSCCTTDTSTTQWWYGSYVTNYIPSMTPTYNPTELPTIPTAISTRIPSTVPTIMPTIVPTIMPTIIPTDDDGVSPVNKTNNNDNSNDDKDNTDIEMILAGAGIFLLLLLICMICVARRKILQNRKNRKNRAPPLPAREKTKSGTVFSQIEGRIDSWLADSLKPSINKQQSNSAILLTTNKGYQPPKLYSNGEVNGSIMESKLKEGIKITHEKVESDEDSDDTDIESMFINENMSDNTTTTSIMKPSIKQTMTSTSSYRTPRLSPRQNSKFTSTYTPHNMLPSYNISDSQNVK